MKWIIINPRQLYALLLVLFLGATAYFCYAEDAVGIDHIVMGVLFTILGLVVIFCIFLMPICYIFSKEEVRIIYHFGIRQYAKWRDVDMVRIVTETHGKPPNFHSYEIWPIEGDEYFFTEGNITKCIATKVLIHRYWNGEIDGEWHWHNVTEWFRIKFGKKPELEKKRRKKKKRKKK